METATNERLNALLDYLTDTMKSGVDFASEQAPLVAKEIAAYGAVSSWVYVAIGLAVVATGVAATRLIMKWDEQKEDFHPKHMIATFAGVVCVMVGTGIVASNLNDAMKATFAPRVYVLEYVAKLVK